VGIEIDRGPILPFMFDPQIYVLYKTLQKVDKIKIDASCIRVVNTVTTIKEQFISRVT